MCVEIAESPTRMSVRDSKVPARAILSFPATAFTAFIEFVKREKEL
ncbi:DUF397 domain-containing protein [Streptomyces sp. JW3]